MTGHYRVTDKNGHEIRKGDIVTSFRGEAHTFVMVSRGPEYNGTAKVIVRNPANASRTLEYYERVFDLKVEAV